MRFIVVASGEEMKKIVDYLKNYFPNDEFFEVYSERKFYEIVDREYDVVITDYEIPWGSGIRVLREVKKRKEFVPVIMVLSGIFEDVVIEAMKHGLDDYVIKDSLRRLPFSIKIAMERVSRIRKDIEYKKVLLDLLKTPFPDFDSAVKRINEIVSKTLGVERVSLWFYDENKKELVCYDLYTLSKNSHERGIVLKAENYPRYFEAFEKSILIDASDAMKDERTSEYAEYLKEFGIVSMMDIALRKNGKLIGVICHEHNSFREWSIEEKNFIVSVAEFVVNLMESFERKRAEERLKEKEEIYKTIAEKSSSGIFILQDGEIKFANRAFIEAVGYDIDELNRIGYLSVVHEEDRKKVEDAIKDIIEGKAISVPEFRYVAKDGKTYWAVGTGGIIEYEKKPALLGIITDITKTRRAEEKYKRLFERTKDAILASTVEGKFIDANEAALKLLGYESKEELSKIDIAKDFYYNPGEREKIMEEVAKKGYIKDYEVEIKRKDGKKLIVLETSHEVRDEKGKLIGYEGIIRDITEKKEMEERLREKEERFSYFLNNAEIGVFCYMLEKPLDISLPEEEIIEEAFKARCVECNDAYARMLGARKEEIIGAMVSEFMPASEENREYLRQAIRNGFKIYGGISHEINKEGEERYFSNSLIGIVKDGKIYGAWGFQIDITEETRAKIALKESEEKFRKIFENASVGIYRTTPDGKILIANPFLAKMLGYESVEELMKRDLKNERHYEPGYERKKFIEQIEKDGYFRGISAWKRRDGKIVWVRESAIAVRDKEGKTIYYEGIAEDITELMEKEKALTDAKEEWEKIFNSITDPSLILAPDHTILDANISALNLLNKRKEEIIGKKCYEIFHSSRKPAEKCPMVDLLISSKPEIKSMEMSAVQGEFIVTVSPVMREGKVDKIIHIAKEITKIKEMNKALIESERKYRTIVENSSDAIYIYAGNKFLFVNDRVCQLTGYTKEELLSIDDIYQLIHPDDRERVREYGIKRAKGEEVPNFYSAKVLTKNGDVRECEFRVNVITYEGKYAVLGVVRDLTEEIKTLIALEESEKKYRSVVESASDAIYIITPSGFQYVNPAFEKLTGYSKEELLSKDFSFWKLIYEEDKKLIKEREMARIRGKKIPSRYEFRIVRKDNKVRIVETTTVEIGAGEEVKVMGILRDVSEKREAEEEIKKLSDLHYYIGKCVNESDRLEDLCKNFLKNLLDIIDIEYGNIFIYEKERNSLIPIAYLNYPEEFLERNIVEYSLNDKKREAVKSFLTMKKRYIKNLQNYKPLSYNLNLYKKYKMKELLTLPLKTKNEIHGIIQVMGTQEKPLTENKIRLLEAVSEELAGGIAKVKAIERVKEALEREMDFKARAAHYFFNPLVIAKGYLELAKEEDGKDKIEKAIKALERIEKVIKNVTQRGEIVE
ncbi:MAG: MEKHLA domain-containing protein [Thermoplasmatales archaeon]|nr:MEKHLA domain-containing protein [Thermoplasmatales archaeon]